MPYNSEPEPLPPPPWETDPLPKSPISSVLHREMKLASRDVGFGALIFISLLVLFIGGIVNGCEDVTYFIK